jgi:hypothetical protein
MKLPFAGVSKLRHDYREWLNGDDAGDDGGFGSARDTTGTVLRNLSVRENAHG